MGFPNKPPGIGHNSGGREIEVTLPTFHSGQLEAYAAKRQHKYMALRAGRRYGKTDFAKTWGADGAIKGQLIGWFAPQYKTLAEAFKELADLVRPVKTHSSKTDGVIRLIGGGRIDFWSLENANAGRGRKYHKVIVDEAAFTEPNMMDIWDLAIKPTLTDYEGECLATSNACGTDPENWFWRICNQPEHEFFDFHAPTEANPLLPLIRPGETDAEHAVRRMRMLADLKAKNPPLVYAQEYLAEFVDWSGEAFFALPNMMQENGEPFEYPTLCDNVFAVIDSAAKTGKENDGTAVTFFAFNELGNTRPLLVLDYDIMQIEGYLLENWLPQVFRRLLELVELVGARLGSAGVWIEDKSTGMVLLQYGRAQGFDVHQIDSRLTAAGKSERAINVSGHVYSKQVGFTRFAYDKLTTYKTQTINHLVKQVLAFRVGNKDQIDDDLLDTFTYGLALALGNGEGFG